MKKIDKLEKHLIKMGYSVLYNGDGLLDVAEQEDSACIFSILFNEDTRDIEGMMISSVGKDNGFISMDVKNTSVYYHG